MMVQEGGSFRGIRGLRSRCDLPSRLQHPLHALVLKSTVSHRGQPVIVDTQAKTQARSASKAVRVSAAFEGMEP